MRATELSPGHRRAHRKIFIPSRIPGSCGDWLVVTDNLNRVLLYSISTVSRKRSGSATARRFPEAATACAFPTERLPGRVRFAFTETDFRFSFSSYVSGDLFSATGSASSCSQTTKWGMSWMCRRPRPQQVPHPRTSPLTERQVV